MQQIVSQGQLLPDDVIIEVRQQQQQQQQQPMPFNCFELLLAAVDSATRRQGLLTNQPAGQKSRSKICSSNTSSSSSSHPANHAAC
jgi:hypothetical protein